MYCYFPSWLFTLIISKSKSNSKSNWNHWNSLEASNRQLRFTPIRFNGSSSVRFRLVSFSSHLSVSFMLPITVIWLWFILQLSCWLLLRAVAYGAVHSFSVSVSVSVLGLVSVSVLVSVQPLISLLFQPLYWHHLQGLTFAPALSIFLVPRPTFCSPLLWHPKHPNFVSIFFFFSNQLSNYPSSTFIPPCTSPVYQQ